jgi:hypothetical protein
MGSKAKVDMFFIRATFGLEANQPPTIGLLEKYVDSLRRMF